MKKFVNLFAAFVVAFLGFAAQAAGLNAAGVPSYDGNWWNSKQNGEGLVVTHQNGKVFALFFGYSLDGRPMFFQVGGALQKTQEGFDTLPTTDAYMTTGPQPLGFDPAKVKATRVGTASITFFDPYHAAMTYQYQDPSGGSLQSGTLSLSQLQFGCDATTGAMWNNTYCVIPQGVKVTSPKSIPDGCTNWQDKCWQDSIANGTVKLIATSAKMTGLPGYDGRSLMYAYYLNTGGTTATSGPYSVQLLYADTGAPVSATTLAQGFGTAVDWIQGTTKGALFHGADGTCWENQWFGPDSTSGNRNVWVNVPATCP